MLQTTVQLLRAGAVDVTNYRIYVVKNGAGDVLYVGQSYNICSRLRGHIPNRSLLGAAISDNRPQSLQWEVDIYTIEECSETIKKHSSPFDTQTRPMDRAELALIRELAPRYNQLPYPSFTEKREVHPELQSWMDAKQKVREEEERASTQKQKEQQELLIQSFCTICGERDTWQYSNGDPCGVIGSVLVVRGAERLYIDLVCHDCNKIIKLLSTLEGDAERVSKVQAAIQNASSGQYLKV